MLLGGGSHALMPDHEGIAVKVGLNGLGAADHVVLPEATKTFTHAGFDLCRGSRGNSIWTGRNDIHPRGT